MTDIVQNLDIILAVTFTLGYVVYDGVLTVDRAAGEWLEDRQAQREWDERRAR